MNTPLRVVLVHTYYRLRGGEDVVFEMERDLLRDHGHEVRTFIRHNSAFDQFGPAGMAARTIWNGRAASELEDFIRTAGADIVHIHNTFPSMSPTVIRASARTDAAVLMTLHNYRVLCPAGTLIRNGASCTLCAARRLPTPAVRHGCYRQSRPASLVASTSLALHRAVNTYVGNVDRFIAISEHVRDRHVEFGVPADQIVVKPNFMDPDPLPGTGEDGSVLFVGRLVPEKGINLFLHTAAELGANVPVRIVGGGPLESLVREAADRLPNLEWLGEVNHGTVLDHVGRAAVVVVPSLWEEPFGRTVIEAFARGTPVVVSDRGALPSLVGSPTCGRIVCGRDPSQWAATIAQVMSSGAELRRGARDAFEARFTARRAYIDLMQAYGAAHERKRALGSAPLAAVGDGVRPS